MRVLLVNMPWSPIDVPSLALGILKRAVDEKTDGQAEVLHANLEYVDWLARQGEFALGDYEYYSLDSYFLGCGDWVFSSALYDDPRWREAEFTELLGTHLDEDRLRQAIELHRQAPRFVQEIAEAIVAAAPDVVGFTSTFQQNIAALAAAKYVKRLAPRIVTVLGGANCDGAQGEAMHRNFPFVDHVIRGEGEVAFPQLLNALTSGQDLAKVPSLCWRDGSGPRANPISATPLPPAAILRPDYRGYFERLAASHARTWTEPKLVVEGARGCWWGEKHHCTFCGLNGSSMRFRSKHPDDFFTEIVELAREHQVLDMFVVDNILDMGYLTTVLPRLIETGYDLRLHIEIKANMRQAQLRTLADAGLIYVQPGIESLNNRVLDLMDKGVSGCQNVRMLRDGSAAGLSVAWNYLHGFPGEQDRDYDAVIGQLPALEHLDPPGDLSARIAIERFSPYFNRPELGFSELRPALPYRVVYDLPEDELLDLAYIFDVPPRGIGEETVARLNEALAGWQQNHAASRLTHTDLGEQIVLVSRRRAFDWTVLELSDPLELAAFRLLDQPHAPAALARKIAARPGCAEVDLATVQALLDRWSAQGLVFTDNGQYVQVAPPAVNQELLRLGYRRARQEAEDRPAAPREQVPA
ncbi:RiPP maturation radical SAM C-methyltransferase [Kitasatospora sp. NPDC008050]|uniref:RiPP maturation radical SAM C-methyltransferase n=1 Tax=Kitasatospora sp. NPDC008050 TaxID=3364021 RepID=UPI0036EBFDFB